MPSTGINNGTLLTIYVGGTAVAHSTSASLSLNMSTRDATTKSSSGWSDKLEGVRDWSMSGECFFAEDAAYGYEDIFDLVNGRTTATVKYSSSVTGDKEYTGTAYFTSLERTAPTEDSETYSFSLEGTGALAKATIA